MTYCIRSLQVIITVMKISYITLGNPSFPLPCSNCCHFQAWFILYSSKFFFSWVYIWSLQWDYNSWEQIIALFLFWFVPQCLAQYLQSLINDYKCMHVTLLGLTLRFSSIFLALEDSLHLFIRNFRRLLSFLSYFFLFFPEKKTHTKFYISFGILLLFTFPISL